jgi:hypothetical protein
MIGFSQIGLARPDGELQTRCHPGRPSWELAVKAAAEDGIYEGVISVAIGEVQIRSCRSK